MDLAGDGNGEHLQQGDDGHGVTQGGDAGDPAGDGQEEQASEGAAGE
jgi:hypothetical protein